MTIEENFTRGSVVPPSPSRRHLSRRSFHRGISIRESRSRATFSPSRLKPWRSVKKKKRRKKEEKNKKISSEANGKREKEGREIRKGRIRDAEWDKEWKKPRKMDGGVRRRNGDFRRLIVSENPSSRSFCFRFYFLPSNPLVHCLPFVHTIPRASSIPASRDFYLVTLQTFRSPLSLSFSSSSLAGTFSPRTAFSLLTLLPAKHTRPHRHRFRSLACVDKGSASTTSVNRS